MKTKIIKATFLPIVLSGFAVSFLNAQTNNQVDNGYNDTKGYYFYDDPKNVEANKSKKQKKERIEEEAQEEPKSNPKGLESKLDALLNIEKERLKVDKEILVILKNEFAPEPRLITKPDGTQCVENSSSDCYVFPLIPEAKRVPVLAGWLSNPTQENTVKWLQWQAKYFNQIKDIGESIPVAVAQYGTDAYPIGFQRSGMESVGGIYGAVKEKFNAKLLNLLGKKGAVSLTYYIGKDLDMDIFSMDAIAKTMSELPDVKINLVFFEQASQKVYNDGARTFKDFQKALSHGNISTKVAPQEFTANHVTTTPTLFVRYNNNGKSGYGAIENGKHGDSETIENIFQYLEYVKAINRTERVDEKVWSGAGNYSADYLRNAYGINLDKKKIKGYFNGN